MAIVDANQRGGQVLRQRRKALGVSQEKLAREAACSTMSVRLFESGFLPERSDVLPRLLATLARLEAAAD
jgi:transcriptional regulator with XRE-family HTH domain